MDPEASNPDINIPGARPLTRRVILDEASRLFAKATSWETVLSVTETSLASPRS
jgi:hypothetical protein